MGVSSRRSIVRMVCAVFATSLFAFFASGQQPKVLAPHRPIAPKVDKPVPLPPKPGSIAGGPWIVDANFQSTIYLKNSVETSPITVTPVLHLSNGARYRLSPVQLEPAGIAIVDINSGLEKLGIVPMRRCPGGRSSNITGHGYRSAHSYATWMPRTAWSSLSDSTRPRPFPPTRNRR